MSTRPMGALQRARTTIPSPNDVSPRDGRVLKALLLFNENLLTPAEAAAAAGMDTAEFALVTRDPGLQARASLEARSLVGPLTEAKAERALKTVVERVHHMVETEPDLGVTALQAAGTFLIKASGVEQRRAAELRIETPGEGVFSVQILYRGEQAPANINGIVMRVDTPRPSNTLHAVVAVTANEVNRNEK